MDIETIRKHPMWDLLNDELRHRILVELDKQEHERIPQRELRGLAVTSCMHRVARVSLKLVLSEEVTKEGALMTLDEARQVCNCWLGHTAPEEGEKS